jgi:hypothetical protein
MLRAHLIGPVSLALSLIVGAIAAALAAWQWRERKHRPDDLSGPDESHYARQDVRRLLGAATMALIAVGVGVGSRISPGARGRPSGVFVGIWLLVFALVFGLLLLSWLDILATRGYARRHRRQIAEDRQAYLIEQTRRHRGNTDA